MLRFTVEQRNFSEAMKFLIDLYYRVQNTDQKQWFSKQVIDSVSKILGLTIPNFYPCLYFQGYSFFRYRDKNEKISLLKGHLTVFIEFMDAIAKDIDKGIYEIFEIKGLVKETRQWFNSEDYLRFFKTDNAEVQDAAGKTTCKIVPSLPAGAGVNAKSKFIELRSNALNRPSYQFESFQVSVNSASHLYENFWEEEGGKISAPGYIKPDASFLHVIKFILIKYQHLMGSFERLKLCRYCGKIFFEKRIGSKEYCSASCRKKFNDALQMPEVRLCRERQNAWIRYKYENIVNCPRVYYLQKDECEKCSGEKKGGNCPPGGGGRNRR